MEFKSDENRIVLRRIDRDEFGQEGVVEHYLTYGSAQRLYNELSQAMRDCRQFMVENNLCDGQTKST